MQQRDDQFDDAKGRADMPACDGNAIDQPVAHLLRELRQLRARQLSDIGGALDAGEQGHGRSRSGVGHDGRVTIYRASAINDAVASGTFASSATAHCWCRTASARAASTPSTLT